MARTTGSLQSLPSAVHVLREFESLGQAKKSKHDRPFARSEEDVKTGMPKLLRSYEPLLNERGKSTMIHYNDEVNQKWTVTGIAILHQET